MLRFNARWGLWVLLGLWSVLSPTSYAADAPPLLEIKEGDRIALVGGAFFEREQRAGYIETVLTLSHPGVAFKLRNFAWSGDTVWGEARAGFDTPKEGYERLIARVAEFKPTLILIGYGLNESFKGEPGLAEFRAGLKRVLDDLGKDGARIALVSPLPLENLGPPLPDPAEANRNIKLYGDEIAEEAASRKAAYLDLATALTQLPKERESPLPLTDDGIHFTDHGYWRAAEAFARAAGLLRAQFHVDIDLAGQKYSSGYGLISEGADRSMGQEINFLKPKQTGLPRVRVRMGQLPCPPSPATPAHFKETLVSMSNLIASIGVMVGDLPVGIYKLEIDEIEVARAPHNAWDFGVHVHRGPEFDQVEELRRTIIRKNELFFHRWRPQNDTYLFLFRKHEQGQNAVEIPRFDPLVEELDAKITELAKPKFHTYEFIPLAEAGQ